MNLSLSIEKRRVEAFIAWLERQNLLAWIAGLSLLAAVFATTYFFFTGHIVAYGDSESHLNIAKRVVDNLTPGFAQLGGIWLPLPHLMLIPFVYFDFLWRTGLAGSIVSGICFVVSSVYLYKLAFLLTRSRAAAFAAALVFITNPNILYLQSTPMTELPLIVFFILSTYYFIVFTKDTANILALISAGFFGFCATLSRYDGWALVLMQAGILFLLFFPWRKIIGRHGRTDAEGSPTMDGVRHSRVFGALKVFSPVLAKNFVNRVQTSWSSSNFHKFLGLLILFGTVAFFGVGLWLLWDWIILGDPLYFTHSVFSAKSQQAAWLARGELPAYGNIGLSFLYYFVTSMSNIGVILFLVCLVGFVQLLFGNSDKKRWYIALVLLVPFFFNVATLFLGQSVIFIPSLTPYTFDWTLFNVRYGVMMVPFAAVCIAYLFYKSQAAGKMVIAVLAVLQIGLYLVGYSQVISYEDGVRGLSSAVAKQPDAQNWLSQNYDGGLVLADDFARSISIIRSPIPMKNMIYVGNKPYWEESLKEPEKYATWIVMQQNDDVWKSIYDNPVTQGRLYKYFNKAYTSPETLIFKRNPDTLEALR